MVNNASDKNTSVMIILLGEIIDFVLIIETDSLKIN